MFRWILVVAVCVQLLFSSTALSQMPPHLWSHAFGGPTWVMGKGVATDAEANIILTGRFNATVDFGGGPLVSAGSNDIFLAKFGPGGTHLWSQRIGDSGYQEAFGVAVDAAGNVFLTGIYTTTLEFFLAKYDPKGSRLWARWFGNLGDQRAFGIATDADGNVYLTGTFPGTLDLGGAPLVSAGGKDIFLAKWGPSGTHLWSQRFGDTDEQEATSVAVDALGSVFITGYMRGTVDFGGGPLTTAGWQDIFLAKFDPNGGHEWSQRFGGTNDQRATSVAVDSLGNVFITGIFLNVVNFGGGPLYSQGGFDIFLAEFDADGVHLRSKRFGGLDDQTAESVATGPTGDVFLAGWFYKTVNFGGWPLESESWADVFVARFDPNLGHVWSQRFGGADYQYGQQVAIDAWGNAAVVGYFNGAIDFGGGPFVSLNIYDTFLAKLVPTDDPTSIPSATPRSTVALTQNYPNPFNPTTTIRYDVPGAGEKVTLRVFDVSGKVVRTLVNGVESPGQKSMQWDGRNDRGEQVSTGVYFYRLTAGDKTLTKKMVLLK